MKKAEYISKKRELNEASFTRKAGAHKKAIAFEEDRLAEQEIEEFMAAWNTYVGEDDDLSPVGIAAKQPFQPYNT